MPGDLVLTEAPVQSSVAIPGTETVTEVIAAIATDAAAAATEYLGETVVPHGGE